MYNINMSHELKKDYTAFNKLLCPILAINYKYDVIFLNNTAKKVYNADIENIKGTAALEHSVGINGKCYKISHGYDRPCFELDEDCPVRDLINDRDKKIALVQHNHKGNIYKVEAYRDDEDDFLFLESHINITGFISEMDVIKKAKEEIESSQKKLKESEELFRTLIDNLPISIGMHKDKYIYANPEFLKMFGYTKNDLKYLNAWEVDADEYRDAAKIRIGRGLQDINDKYDIVLQGIKKSGEKLWMHIYTNSVKYKGEVVRVASFIDVTEMVNLRDSIEQEKNLFKTLIENIHSGIALYGKEKFIYVNSGLLNLLGFTKDDFLNKRVQDFFDMDENQIYSSKVSLFEVHHNKEFSSRFIYKYNDKKLGIRYIDLFRTVVFYRGEETGLAIFTDVTDQIFREQNIIVEKDIYKELSEIDSLTQIHNRRALDGKLGELFNLAKRYNRPLSLIMFDIDRFKNVNDALGHGIGDIVLKELAAVAKEDLRITDFFARYGGEEFMIIAPETPLETALGLAERLRLNVQNHDFKIGRKITISLGVVSLALKESQDSFISRVDSALYKAKEGGRNLVWSENFN